MRLAAVESAHNLFLQPVGFRGVFRLDHLLGEPAQFLGTEFPAFPGASRQLDDPSLFLSRYPFYFFDDFDRCQGSRFPSPTLRRKAGELRHLPTGTGCNGASATCRAARRRREKNLPAPQSSKIE